MQRALGGAGVFHRANLRPHQIGAQEIVGQPEAALRRGGEQVVAGIVPEVPHCHRSSRLSASYIPAQRRPAKPLPRWPARATFGPVPKPGRHAPARCNSRRARPDLRRDWHKARRRGRSLEASACRVPISERDSIRGCTANWSASDQDGQPLLSRKGRRSRTSGQPPKGAPLGDLRRRHRGQPSPGGMACLATPHDGHAAARRAGAPRQPWQKDHQPNLTGTDQAYRPPGAYAHGRAARSGNGRL